MSVAIDPFHAIELSQRAGQLAAEGRDIIHMEFGQPSAGAPKLALDAAKSALDEAVPGYWQSQTLRQRLSQLYRDDHDVEISPQRVVLTCGASPALVLALSAAFRPGDRIAIARPGYVAYRNTIKGLHLDPVELRCGHDTRFQLTADLLEAIDPAPQGVILASPSNPTGSIIAPEELSRIVEVCRSRGIRILSDEIYHKLTYGTPTHSILRYDQSAFVINSFSKYFCMPGWRMGWLVAPDDMLDAVNARMGNFFLTSPSISQIAALAALEASAELDGHLNAYANNRTKMLERLPELGLTDMAPPDGAFYIYANVERFTGDSFEFCREVLQTTGLVIAPGRDHDPEEGHKSVRFCFAISPDRVDEALSRLETFLNR